jgi:hypothetical protein
VIVLHYEAQAVQGAFVNRVEDGLSSVIRLHSVTPDRTYKGFIFFKMI